NGFLDASDVFLGVRSAGPLAAGTASSGPTSLVIPAGTASGVYYVLAVADFDKQIGETKETNNTRARGQGRAGPALVETSVSVPPIAGAGATIAVTDTVKNQGLGDAPASTTALYISTSAAFNASAIRLASRSVPPLPAGTSNTASTPMTLPADL